ncbi:MAG: glutamate racemase [Candidatus Omnitrophota bacterium]
MSNINKKKYAIGVFDSGLGGLTVVKELMRHLPYENIVYFGDTARVPYGTKSRESIIQFSKENVAVLLRHQVKMIVVACNTSSSLALPALKKTFDLPIVGVLDAGAKKAVALTRTRRVGVIATPATINSRAYPAKISRLDHSVKIWGQACPLFVPLAEEGWFDKEVTYAVAREYLDELKRARVDTLILGCTHYPLLKPVLKKVMGEKVVLVDSAEAVAAEVKELLNKDDLAHPLSGRACYKFLVSDEPKHFRRLAKRFLGYDIRNVRRCGGV